MARLALPKLSYVALDSPVGDAEIDACASALVAPTVTVTDVAGDALTVGGVAFLNVSTIAVCRASKKAFHAAESMSSS
jgi:hypothetical protein